MNRKTPIGTFILAFLAASAFVALVILLASGSDFFG